MKYVITVIYIFFKSDFCILTLNVSGIYLEGNYPIPNKIIMLYIIFGGNFPPPPFFFIKYVISAIYL